MFTWWGVGDRFLRLLSDLVGPAVGVEGCGGGGRRGEGPALEEVAVADLAGARVDYDRHGGLNRHDSQQHQCPPNLSTKITDWLKSLGKLVC